MYKRQEFGPFSLNSALTAKGSYGAIVPPITPIMIKKIIIASPNAPNGFLRQKFKELFRTWLLLIDLLNKESDCSVIGLVSEFLVESYTWV